MDMVRHKAPALADLIGGQVQVMLTVAPSIEYIKAGKVRPLAVTTATRAEGLPDIPTLGEFVARYDARSWVGIGVPRNTPIEIIIYKLNSEINASLADRRVKKSISELGDTTFASFTDEFSKYIVEFTEKWGKVIRAVNIKL